MPLVYPSRAKETSPAVGTSSYQPAGAVAANNVTFLASVGDGNMVPYSATDGTDWEEGIGTVVAGSPTVIQRTAVLRSSNSNSPVNWAGGTITIACAPIAELFADEVWCRQTSNRTLSNSAAAQKLFDKTANGAVTLRTGSWVVDGFLYLTSMSATSGNAGIDVKGAGNAVIDSADVGFHFSGIDNSTPANAGTRTGSAAAGSTASPASAMTAGTGTGMVVQLFGSLRVTTQGTLIPSITLVTAAAAVLHGASFIRFKRMGEPGETYRGDWS